MWFIIGDEPGIAEFAAEVGIQHLPEVDCNPLGTPLVSSIFALARQIQHLTAAGLCECRYTADLPNLSMLPGRYIVRLKNSSLLVSAMT